jgi:hypothetical protein
LTSNAAGESRVGALLEPLGGLAIVASAFLPWVAHGAGSSLDLHDLGDLVLGGDVSAVVPRWVGLAAYVIPVIGALLIVTAAVEGRRARRLTAVWGVAAVLLIAAAAILPFFHHGRPSLGQLVAGVGAVLSCTGTFLRRRSGTAVPSLG